MQNHTAPAALSRLIELQLAAGAYDSARELAASVLATPDLDPCITESILENLTRYKLKP